MHRTPFLPPILWFALGLAIAPALAPAAGSGASGPAANEGEMLLMRPYLVEAKPLTSFGVSLQIFALPNTKRILRMFIREVLPNSEAGSNGLVPGTEILGINRRSVDSFVIGFDPQSELGHLFVNRPRGDRIQLLVVVPGDTTAHTVVLVAGRTRPFNPFVGDWP